MSPPVTRAGVIAVCAALSLVAPWSGVATAVIFAVLGILALVARPEWRYFSRVARPVEVDAGRLIGLAGFAFGIAILAAMVSVDAVGLSPVVFVMAVLTVGGALFGEAIVRTNTDRELLQAGGLCTTGAIAGLLGYGVVSLVYGDGTLGIPAALYLAGTGALATGLVHAVVDYGEDPLLIVGVGGLLWIFGIVGVADGAAYVLGAIAVSAVLGVVAHQAGVASIAGMLSGILLGVITLVYGGIAWFLVLFTFFAVGGLATKYRYTDKAVRGVAEVDQGARGSRNVLGNSLVAMVAVIGYAGTTPDSRIDASIYTIVFAGAIATALADTLSSEVGCLYDDPWLVTTFDRVRAGTDGAITLQGTLAGAAGAGLIAGLAVIAFSGLGVVGAIVVWTGGMAGMLADSLFGATVEGLVVGNEGVNLLATLVGAMIAVALVLVIGGA